LYRYNYILQWSAYSTSISNSALEYAIGNVEENQERLKLNGTHQLLISVIDVNSFLAYSP
jgi:hypothetical protein